MRVTVRPATPGDRMRAAAVLAHALHTDPGWMHVVPDPTARTTVLRAVLTAALADSGAHARVAERGGDVVGAAIWQPAGRYPMSTWRQVRVLPHLLPMMRVGRAARGAQQLGDALDAVFPAEPVVYLQALGVDPTAQRSGVGSALLTEGLKRADAEGHDVYLETSEEENVGYYAHRGFDVVHAPGEVFPGGPVMWFMRRPRVSSARRGPAR